MGSKVDKIKIGLLCLDFKLPIPLIKILSIFMVISLGRASKVVKRRTIGKLPVLMKQGGTGLCLAQLEISIDNNF